MNTFGRFQLLVFTKLLARQTALGFSTRRLAKEVGLSPSMLSMVINGKRQPSSATRRAIAKWLRTPVSFGDNSPGLAFRQFIAEKRAQLSPLTVSFYEAKLEPFVLWCENNEISDVRRVTRGLVSEFLAEIRSGRRESRLGVKPLSNGGLKLHHQTLKTFFKHIGETHDLPDTWRNPLDGIRVKGSQAQTLEYSDTEIRRMFEIVEANPSEFLRLRNVAILTVLLNSSVRASELLAMKVEDLGSNGNIRVSGKGGKQRVVTVAHTGMDAIGRYLDFAGRSPGWLWRTSDGKPLTGDGLRAMFARMKESDPSSFTGGIYPHRFRHTSITRLLRSRVPLRSVQRYAGHSDPQTTLRYAQALDAEEAIAQINSADWFPRR